MPPWIERSRGIRQVVYGANRAPPLAGGPYGCCVAIVNERAATGRNGVSIVCARNDKLMYEVTDYWFTTENYKMFGYSQYADLIRTINCLEGLHNGKGGAEYNSAPQKRRDASAKTRGHRQKRMAQPGNRSHDERMQGSLVRPTEMLKKYARFCAYLCAAPRKTRQTKKVQRHQQAVLNQQGANPEDIEDEDENDIVGAYDNIPATTTSFSQLVWTPWDPLNRL
ncbi:unnamed protein product [Bursaphelenchus xylophilus]|uniref:(pine wood nematode) hypothetical protein n=1 Tax=Bursaphelenchus xylophilus TaxID=6326 RepID=A0A1I7SQH8_BURXY|nr:unnamed protein product [Bursaphelenchus xylophilus]CAG9109916.1 unnamed protein product [Bursaphelenchus xylophilus]